MPEGLAATKALSDKGIKVNMTLCFTVPQALLAARAGARVRLARSSAGSTTSPRTASSTSATWSPRSTTTTSATRSRSSRRRSARANHVVAGGAHRRGYRHRAVRGAEEPRQAPADRPRPGIVPGRLGEGEELMSARPRKRGRRGGGGSGTGSRRSRRSPARNSRPRPWPSSRAMATELELDIKPLKKKDELIDAVFEAKVKAEGFIDDHRHPRHPARGLRLHPHERLPARRPRRLLLDVADPPRSSCAAATWSRARSVRPRRPRSTPALLKVSSINGKDARGDHAAARTSRTSRRSTRTSASPGARTRRRSRRASSISSHPSARASAA